MIKPHGIIVFGVNGSGKSRLGREFFWGGNINEYKVI